MGFECLYARKNNRANKGVYVTVLLVYNTKMEAINKNKK